MDTVKTRKRIGFPSKKVWQSMPAIRRNGTLLIAGHEVMDVWETNYMKMLAGIVARNRGVILEVGYGLGIATRFIQKYHPAQHTIIEFHPEVAQSCRKIYARKFASGTMRLCEGMWEDIVKRLPSNSYDGILFDTYPLTEEQIHKNHFWFFEAAHRLLKTAGVFTYYSDEVAELSSNHRARLRKAGFTNIDFAICKVHPPKDCMYWNKNTIVAPIIIK